MFASPPSLYSTVYNPSNFVLSVQPPKYRDYAKKQDINTFTNTNTFNELYFSTSEQLGSVLIPNDTTVTVTSMSDLPSIFWRAAAGGTAGASSYIILPPAQSIYNGVFFHLINYTPNTTIVSVSGQTILVDNVESSSYSFSGAGLCVVFMVVKEKWCLVRRYG